MATKAGQPNVFCDDHHIFRTIIRILLCRIARLGAVALTSKGGNHAHRSCDSAGLSVGNGMSLHL